MTDPQKFKAVRLYCDHGMSVKAIICHMGCTKARVLRHLALAGITPDPARESSHHGYAAPEHLIGVEGISAESAKFLAKHQPQTPEQEAQFDAEIAAAKARVFPRSFAKRMREQSNA